MGIFGKPNIEKLKATKNFKGLIGALKDKDYHIQKEAIAALVDIGKPAVEPLIQALKDKNVRYKAAEALGKIADEKAVEALIEALKDIGSGARFAALKAIGSVKDARVVEPLIGILKYEVFSIQRKEAAEALGKIGDKRAVEPLIEALKDRDFEVRSGAVHSLGEIGDKRAVGPLTEVLKNKNARWASDSLEKIIGTKAVASIIQTLKDEESKVKREVPEMKKGEIKCSKCGKIIGQLPTSIGEDIRRGGGVVIGGGSLDMSMYQCTICPSCGSAFCDSCQRPSPDPCPKCGKSNLSPGFADLVQKYYNF